jgi:hypothetical protein
VATEAVAQAEEDKMIKERTDVITLWEAMILTSPKGIITIIDVNVKGSWGARDSPSLIQMCIDVCNWINNG